MGIGKGDELKRFCLLFVEFVEKCDWLIGAGASNKLDTVNFEGPLTGVLFADESAKLPTPKVKQGEFWVVGYFE
jgi:hypothetical protein